MSTLATQLRGILVYINGYYLISIFTLGIIGNMANIIVFRKAILKNNGCSLYFVSISFVHLFVLCFGCLVRIFTTLTGFDLTHSSVLFCKFRIYFFIAGIAISRYYLCLISIDRWMITSLNARIRRQSNLRTIRRIIIISTIIWLLFNLHAPIGFRPALSGCVPSSDSSYSTFYVIVNIILAVVPFTVIIFFTTVTLQHVMNIGLMRRRSRSVHPTESIGRNVPSTTQNGNERLSNKNIQLIRLNLIQVIAFILLNLPNTIYTLYSFITGTYQKSTDQIAVDNFFNYTASALLYTHCAITFYLYTLASVGFRKECWAIYQHVQQKLVAFFHQQ